MNYQILRLRFTPLKNDNLVCLERHRYVKNGAYVSIFQQIDVGFSELPLKYL